MTAVLLARVHAFGGDPAVRQLLRDAGSRRSPQYLLNISNWVSYDEAHALWRAGAYVTHDAQFARHVGEDAAGCLNGSPVAMLLRSLGSPEEVYRQVANSAKYTVVTKLEAVEVGPGFAEIVAAPVEGFPRSADHCAWTVGMLSQPTVLFGLAPAHVEHRECAAFGALECRYRLTWRGESRAAPSQESELVVSLRAQLAARDERLASMFATAGDLLEAEDIDIALARITDRAAAEIRAPRYLVAVRVGSDNHLHCHHKGFDQHEASCYAQRVLDGAGDGLPDSALVVAVRSRRRDYGRLLAMYDGRRFLAQERELFEVYARYAASALDSATALLDAKQRYAQSSALLGLARALGAGGTSGDVARRLADAVPRVIDCDRVGVYLWDSGELVRRAVSRRDQHGLAGESEEWRRAPTTGGPWRLLRHPVREPVFVGPGSGDPMIRELLGRVGAVGSILMPLATSGAFLGLLIVSVMSDAERVQPNPDLLDRLSGIAAQATTALQNGRLLDEITYQAQHDGLTGLANRLHCNAKLRDAFANASRPPETVTLFYIDLDGFKPVNDQLGHQIGDELLVAVAGRLTSCTRAVDLVARLGGDEFAVLVVGSERADAVAQRLSDVFSRPFVIGGHVLTLAASIGRAGVRADADGPERLLRLADAAMFENKRAHRRAEDDVLTRCRSSVLGRSGDGDAAGANCRSCR